MTNIDKWALFLANEKLVPKNLGTVDTINLVRLANELSQRYGSPRVRPYAKKQESRRQVANCALDLGIDLAGMRNINRGKMAMGRGLLDIWNIEYAKRFGSHIGTTAWKEAIRRDIKQKITPNT